MGGSQSNAVPTYRQDQALHTYHLCIPRVHLFHHPHHGWALSHVHWQPAGVGEVQDKLLMGANVPWLDRWRV